MKNNKVVVLLCMVLLVSACAKTPKVVDGTSAVFTDLSYFQPKYQRYKLKQNWQFSAKVGVAGGNAKGGQAGLLWRNNQDQINNIKLHGPFGSGAVKLFFDKNGAELIDAKGRQYQGNSAQGLLSRIVGWQVPFAELQYWLYALPHTDFKAQYRLDDQGRLQWLRQRGWQVEFKEFAEYQGQVMPRKIFAKKVDTDPAVSVRLVIKNWSWE